MLHPPTEQSCSMSVERKAILQGIVPTVFAAKGEKKTVTWNEKAHRPLVAAGFVKILDIEPLPSPEPVAKPRKRKPKPLPVIEPLEGEISDPDALGDS